MGTITVPDAHRDLRSDTMAVNFRITLHRSSDSLHLNLTGDFDGSSACELINILQENRNGIKKVYIHTNGIRHIYPFGRGIFHDKSRQLLTTSFSKIILTGNNARKIANEGKDVFIIK